MHLVVAEILKSHRYQFNIRVPDTSKPELSTSEFRAVVDREGAGQEDVSLGTFSNPF